MRPAEHDPEVVARIEKEATASMAEGTDYQQGETVLKRREASYRVEHGMGRRPPLSFDTTNLSDALWRFVHWRHRRCTSCGQPGCARDLVGKKPFTVDPLPDGALP
jgi:hypothetical protein